MSEPFQPHTPWELGVKREINSLQEANEATNERLDAHNHVMTSLTHRIRDLEQQARPEQEDGHLADPLLARVMRAEDQQDKAERAAVESYNRRCQLDLELGAMRERAQAAERERQRLTDGWIASSDQSAQDFNRAITERDAARATVERLSAFARERGHTLACEATMAIQERRKVPVSCTCGLADALKGTP